jgi:hypothetical protein
MIAQGLTAASLCRSGVASHAAASLSFGQLPGGSKAGVEKVIDGKTRSRYDAKCKAL